MITDAQRTRLFLLAEFLDTLPSEQFDITTVVDQFCGPNNCETVCCAIGWTPKLFPDLVEWYEAPNGFMDVKMIEGLPEGSYHDVSRKLFGLYTRESIHLFSPVSYEQDIETGPTVVAARIREFLADNIYSSS